MGATKVAQYKVERAKLILETQPNITASKLKNELDCCIGTAEAALQRAREQTLEESRKLVARAKTLKEKRVRKAIESQELQIDERLTTMRATVKKLQDIANETEDIDDLKAAVKAQQDLTKYERQVTGIEAEEKATASRAGASTINVVIPPDLS